MERNSAKLLQFLELGGKLKHVPRTGWVLRDVKSPEPIAGHMYRMALMTFLLENEDQSLNRTRCMEMALIHDVGESIIGDFTPNCKITRVEKARLELDAVERIKDMTGGKAGQRMLELFKEYEEQATEEAKFVKQIDLFDMLLQAHEYEKRDNCPGHLQEFIDSTRGKFTHPFVLDLVNEVYSQRDKLISDASK